MPAEQVAPGHYEAMVTSSADAILSWDRDLNITTWNAAAERMYGYRAAEAVGRAVSTLIPEDRAGEERRILDEVLEGRRVYNYETERVRKDGRTIDVSITVSPIREGDGEITGASVIARDITTRRRARERADRLQQITVELSRELRPERTVEVLLANALPALGADAGAVGLLAPAGTHVELVGSVGYSEAISAFDRMRVEADLPITEAIRTGESMWLAGGARLRTQYPALVDSPDQWASLAVVPLVVGDRPFGAVALSFAEARGFGRDERAFMVAAVQQAAHALERSRLFDAERRRREQLDFIVEASEVLAASLDVDETLQRLAVLAVPRIADWCSIDLVSDDGSVRNVAVAHRDAERTSLAKELRRRYPQDPGASRGVSNVIRTGKQELYEAITDDELAQHARDGEHLRMLRELGMRSVMIVPLVARGRTLGTMNLVAAESGRRYTPEDLDLAGELARHAGLSIDNAALYRREHEAAVTLQRALLPPRLPSPRGIDVAASYLPAGSGLEVGGDWYDLVETADGKLTVIVGDVAGRGLAAATIMGRLRTALRAYVLEGYGPSEAVERLDALMSDFDEPTMATLVHLSLDPTAGTVEYVRAGHPPPLVRDPDHAVEPLGGRGSPPLGVIDDPVFRANPVEIAPGSVLLLYTDGLIERRREGLAPGLDRLRHAFAGAPETAEDCARVVIDELAAPTLPDDVALVALRFVGA